MPAPPIALASEFDARPWADTAVCQRLGGGPEISLPAYGPSGDTGLYLDARHFLNGFAVEDPRDLGAQLTAGWAAIGGGGTIAATIDATGRLAIDNGGVADLYLLAAPGNARFGVPAAGVTVPAGTEVVMADDWQSGVVDPDEYLELGRDGSLDSVGITVRRVDDVRIALRQRDDIGDLDDTGDTTLQSLDPLVWWGVVGGYVWWATTAATTGMDWLDNDFRDRLGFTGDEAVVTWGTSSRQVRGQVAGLPLPGWVEPSRPLRRQQPRVESVGSTARHIDGSYSSSEIGVYYGWTIEGWIDGPEDVGVDIHRHWLELLGEYAPPGSPLTLYQSVGDSRRALDPRRVNADQPAHDRLYNSAQAGYRGRILCRVNPASGREAGVEADGPFRRRFPFELVLDVREAGV